jgi:hypothetical protein
MIEKEIYKESFFINQYTGDSNQIQNHIDHILTFDKGRVISNRNGYQSNDISFGFYDLIKFSIDSLLEINIKAKLCNFWLNINNGNSFNLPHIHDIHKWSGVYYHKVCCDKSTINFHHLVPTIISESFIHSPKEKEMIFFKGNKPHSVTSCGRDGHERISLAFNFDVI